MNCTEFEKLIDAYIDQELNEGVEAFEEHLETCESCKALYEETQEIKMMLSSLEPLDLPENFEAELHNKLVDAAKSLKDHKKVVPFYRSKYIKAIGSIAALGIVAVLLVNTGFPRMGSNNEAGDMEFEANLMANYDDGDSADVQAFDGDVEEKYTSMIVEESSSDEMASNDMVTEDAVEEDMPVEAEARLTLTAKQSVYTEEVYNFTIDDQVENVLKTVVEYDVHKLDVYNQNINFYILDSDFDDFKVTLLNKHTIVEEQMFSYVNELNLIRQNYQDALDKKEDESEIEYFKNEVDQIEAYKGFKQINILIEENKK